jgi:hypothetical protein
MKVARHEMPGNLAFRDPSRRDGHLASTFPGISCLATLSQSLRDNYALNSSTRPLKNLRSTSFCVSSRARL